MIAAFVVLFVGVVAGAISESARKPPAFVWSVGAATGMAAALLAVRP